ncbi:hypothetical protein GCM10027589_32380 [Actinocorallia lasiicapitis]
MRRLVCGGLLLAVLAGGGCADAGTEPVPAGVTVLKVGQTAEGLTFTGVENDSRCPRAVDCVWAGDATVVVTAGGARHELHVNADPKTATVGGHTVELVALDPYPEAPGQLDPSSYQATFKIG